MITLTSPSINQQEIKAVSKILSSGRLERGEATRVFEKKAKKRFGAKYAIAVNNATAGLFVSLLACGVSTNDEVLTSPFTFMATANSILMCNALPVFVDIDTQSYTINPSLLRAKITPKTKAILAVDLYGHPARYEKIQKIAQKNNLHLIADASQATGALYDKKPLSDFADVVVLSFFETKNITSGEGGLVLTNNDSIAERINTLINHGQKRGEKYHFLSLGYNFRPTDVQSAILNAQLQKLTSINKRRIHNARYILEHLKNISGLELPSISHKVEHVFNRFTIRITSDFPLSREHVRQTLLKKFGIETEIAYPAALHHYPHITSLGYKKGDFPVAEKAAEEVLSLPIHQHLSQKNLRYIAHCLKQISISKT